MGYHQLRMVGGYRSRRNPDLRDPVAVPSGLENGGKPCGRSDDHLRGNVRGSVSDLAHGSCVERLLRASLPEYPWSFVGELQLPAAVGRIRDLYVLHRFLIILVLRSAA